MPSQNLSHVGGPLPRPMPTAEDYGEGRYVRAGVFERRSLWRWRAFVVSLIALVGCATYTPPPLTVEHPAYPEAMPAPDLPPSTTLAYTPADLPAPRPAVLMAQHRRQDASAPGQQHTEKVTGEGRVVAVVPGNQQIVVSHDEITDFMEAMTMGYQVDPPALLEGLQAGDTVRFTIDTQQKAIVQLEKLKQ